MTYPPPTLLDRVVAPLTDLVIDLLEWRAARRAPWACGDTDCTEAHP